MANMEAVVRKAELCREGWVAGPVLGSLQGPELLIMPPSVWSCRRRGTVREAPRTYIRGQSKTPAAQVMLKG